MHLIASSTLAELERVAGEPIESLRYRPNVVIDTPDLPPFIENTWVGRELRLGSSVRLQVLMVTPRCAVPTLSHGDLPPRPEALRTAARLNSVELAPGVKMPCVGVHARVLTNGAVACGNEVMLASG